MILFFHDIAGFIVAIARLIKAAIDAIRKRN